jgi:hypothetical protein
VQPGGINNEVRYPARLTPVLGTALSWLRIGNASGVENEIWGGEEVIEEVIKEGICDGF